MGINRFFAEILGAKRRNPVWSWGATDPLTNRVFLCVWEHQIESVPDGERVYVADDEPRLNSSSHKAGFNERARHLDRIQNSAAGFGVVCTAVDPHTKKSKRIDKFDETTLLQLGDFTKEDGRTYASIDARVSVRELTLDNPILADVLIITRKKIDSTTKAALVNARVGQGKFRSEVLELWGNCCAVTGSATRDAIRASHIKPWRYSTNEERLDPKNGLPLVASLDALFDAGLISFASSGTLIVSSVMPKSERQIFGLNSQSLTKTPPQKTVKYLAYHCDRVFKKMRSSK